MIEIEKEILEYMKILYGVDNPLFSFNKIKEEGKLAKMLPRYFLWFFKFLKTVKKINELKEPIEVYISKIVKNRSLRDIVIQHFFRGTPSFFALSYFYLYADYIYPRWRRCFTAKARLKNYRAWCKNIHKYSNYQSHSFQKYGD